MPQRELQILLDLKDNASKELKGFRGKLRKMQPAFRKMAMAGTASLAAIGAGVTKAVQTFGEFEQIEVAFESMLGSGEKAVNMMKDLQEFSATTPFQFKDIAK